MDFELTIAGLCLLVDDPKNGDVHVIIPATAHGGHGAHEPHNARFVHPASSGISGDLIDGYHFDCRGLADTASPPIGIPTAVLDIADVCASAIHIIDEIITSPDDRKSAHVVLRGGKIAPVGQPVCCMIAGRRVDVAGQVTWTIKMLDPKATLRGTVPGGTEPALIVIPRESAGVLRMGLVNSTARDTPATLEDLQRTPRHRFAHFAAFYALFEKSCSEVPQDCPDAKLMDPSQCMSVRTSRA